MLARQGIGCEAGAAATQRPPAHASVARGAELSRTPDGCPSAALLRSPGAACRALLGSDAPRSIYNVSGDVCDPSTARREVCRLDEFERACRVPRGARLTDAFARRHAFGVHELGCCRGGAHARSRRRGFG